MEHPLNKRPHRVDVTMCASPSAGASELRAPLTLQDLVATPGLGARIMAEVPLPDRVRLRGVCQALKAAVDASLQALLQVSREDLLGLDGWGRSNGDVLTWLASKCPNLKVLRVQGVLRHWWSKSSVVTVLTQVATHCRQLTTLELDSCRGVSDICLFSVAAKCSELRNLDVGGCQLITDAGVSAIAAACRQLEHLNLGSLPSVTDGSMLAIAALCPHLQHLDVNETNVRDVGIIAVARSCPALRVLNVADCKGVGDDSAVVVAENCQMLESLEYSESGIGDRGVAAVMLKCLQLQELDIYCEASDDVVRLGPGSCRQLFSLSIYADLTNHVISVLAAHCSVLTHLVLYNVATDDMVAAFAAHCPHLEVLDADDSEVLTDAGVMAVANNCRRLHTLSVQWCEGVTDVSLAELAQRCPSLRNLKVKCSYAGNRTMLALAQHCTDLRSVDVSSGPSSLQQADQGLDSRGLQEAWDEVCVKDEGLAAVLHKCLRLKTLKLSNCRGLTDAGIRLAGDSCKQLRELEMNECLGCFTDRGLAAMAPNLVALESFSACDCDAVTDASVMALATHCSQLRHVEVSECKVGDEGIAAVARHCTVVRLFAARCEGVTDAGMQAISEHCTQLKHLVVSGCRGITAAGVMAVASKCKQLTNLDTCRCSVAASDVEKVRVVCQHIQHLRDRD
eukprot:jgi/Mesvir1/21346/Mv20836-RA.1